MGSLLDILFVDGLAYLERRPQRGLLLAGLSFEGGHGHLHTEWHCPFTGEAEGTKVAAHQTLWLLALLRRRTV